VATLSALFQARYFFEWEETLMQSWIAEGFFALGRRYDGCLWLVRTC